MAKRSIHIIIDVDFDGEDAKDRLENMKDRAKDFGPVLRWAGRTLERAYSENFTTLGLLSAQAMLRGAWPPLDAEYGAWKSTRFPGAPILVRTGELFRSVGSLDSSSKNTMSDTSATFVVDSPIAKFHQYGTKNMPARRIVFVPRDFDREIGKKAANYIVDGGKIT